jgi:hypothetical protein
MVRRGMVVSYVHGYVEAFYAPHAGEGNQILQNKLGSWALLVNTRCWASRWQQDGSFHH